MKKFFFLILLCGFSLGTASSQVLIALVFGDKLNTPNIEFGLNAGASFSTIANYPDARYKSGLNVGLYFNFKLGDHFYLHPELLFLDQLGSAGTDNRDLPDPGLQQASLSTWKGMNYLTLVILPRYKLTNHLYFEAGIHGSFLYNASEIFKIEPGEKSELFYRDDVLDEMIRGDFGFDVGLGYKFGGGDGLNLSLRYSHGFINTVRSTAYPAEYNRAFRVHVGIPIGVGSEDVKQKIDN